MKYQVRHIVKYYNNLKVLDDISIDFHEAKTTCILGPSGCGKTTLLNIISGMIPKDSGDIVGFKEGNISFIFQEDRLIEWKDVGDNIRFVLKGKVCREEMEMSIDRYLKVFKLEQYKNYYPKELSGGMRQRVNILRAFIYPATVVIMDEPFKSLDINNKQIAMKSFEQLEEEMKKTSIFVTHDIEEAIALGDRIVVFSERPARVKKIIDSNRIIDEKANKTRIRELIDKELTI